MKQLLKFELYKIFQQKPIYFLSIFLFGYLSLGIISNASFEDKTTNKAQYEGPIPEEVISMVSGTANDKQKSQIPSEIYGEMVNNVQILQNLDKRTKVIEEKLSSLKGEGFEYRKSIMERELLKNISQPVYYEDIGLMDLIYYSETIAILIAVLITIGLAGIFSIENTTGVDQLILSAEKGRKEIVTAKILAAVIFSTIVCITFHLYALCLIKFCNGHFGWSSLLQYVYSFYESPYALTMGQYYFIQLGIQLIATISYCLFILLVSSLSKNAFISFAVSGFVYINFIWIDLDAYSKIAKIILCFTSYGLMKVSGLFKNFEVINVFGYPLLLPFAAIVFIVIVSLILMKMIYAYNRMKYLE
ncbi:ABC transporter permease subunit [Niallia sp. 01092]|uniref:ABC transporter permease subunit n=1 Tax=unclassified Niallia TaxID=2837522 RepID=UPI003FD22C7D